MSKTAKLLSSDLKRPSDPKKRELFARLADHYKVLAAEIIRAMVIDHPNLPGPRG